MTEEIDYTGWREATNAEIEGISALSEATGFAKNIFPDCEILKILLDRSEYAGQHDLTLWILTITDHRLRQIQPGKPSGYIVQIAFYEVEDVEIGDFNCRECTFGSFWLSRKIPRS